MAKYSIFVGFGLLVAARQLVHDPLNDSDGVLNATPLIQLEDVGRRESVVVLLHTRQSILDLNQVLLQLLDVIKE